MLEILSSPAGRVLFNTADGVQPYFAKFPTPISRIRYGDTVNNVLSKGLDATWKVRDVGGIYSTVFAGKVPNVKFYYGAGVPETILSSQLNQQWSVDYDGYFIAPITGIYYFYFGGSGIVDTYTLRSTAYPDSDVKGIGALTFSNNDYSSSVPFGASAGEKVIFNINYKPSFPAEAGLVVMWDVDSASITPDKVLLSAAVTTPFNDDSSIPTLSRINGYSNIRFSEKEDGESTLKFEVPLVGTNEAYNWDGYRYNDTADAFVSVAFPDKTLPTLSETVGHWRFQGNLTDISGSSNDFTGTGIDISDFDAGITEQGITSVVIATPDLAFISGGSAGDFNPGTSSFTIELIIKPNTGFIGSEVMQKVFPDVVSAPNAGWRITHVGGGVGWRLEISDGSVHLFTDQPITSLDTWQYVAFVVDRTSDTLTPYVDGVVGTSIDMSTLSGSITNSRDLRIVTPVAGAADFDEICFTTRTLTSTEIQSRYNGLVLPDLKQYRMVEYSSGYMDSANATEQLMTKFTGQIRDFDIKYSRFGNDMLEVSCNDYSIFTKDVINLLAPTPIDYWQAGYLTNLPGRVNGNVKPRAFDGWALHKAYEILLTESFIDSYSFYTKKKKGNYVNQSTSISFLVEPLNSDIVDFFAIKEKYGIPAISEVEPITDEEYSFSIGTGETFQNAINKLFKQWFYNWGFDPQGNPYLRRINVPHKIYNSVDFDSVDYHKVIDLNAFKGGFIDSFASSAGAIASVDAVGKKFTLMSVAGHFYGTSDPTESSFMVTIRNDGNFVSSASYSPIAATAHFYGGGPELTTGINPSIINIANGLPHDEYRIVVDNLGNFKVGIEGILAYDEEYEVAVDTYYTGDSQNKGSISDLGVKKKVDDHRTDAIVLGRRTGTLFRTDGDGEIIPLNPENETKTFVQSATRDLNSLYKSTAINYVGHPRVTIVIDPAINSQQQADFISFNIIEEYGTPKKESNFSLAGNPTLQVGDVIAVVDDYKKVVKSSDHIWVTGVTESINNNKYLTKIDTTPVKPVNSFWKEPPLDLSDFGGALIQNLKILNGGAVGILRLDFPFVGQPDLNVSLLWPFEIQGTPAARITQDLIPINGYCKIGNEIIKYSSADYSNADVGRMRFTGITRALGTDHEVVFNRYSVPRSTKVPLDKFRGSTVVIASNPYSRSQPPPIISFDLLKDANVEVTMRNDNRSVFVGGGSHELTPTNKVASVKIDALTNINLDLNEPNFQQFQKGHYDFVWGGFDRRGVYNNSVKELTEGGLTKTHFYARENYPVRIKRTAGDSFTEIQDSAFGIFYSQVFVVSNDDPLNVKHYFSRSKDQYSLGPGDYQGSVKQILMDPGIIDLSFSTSDMYLVRPNQAGNSFERSGRAVGPFEAPPLVHATNYPFSSVTGVDTTLPVFIRNEANPTSGSNRGFLFSITEHSEAQDPDIDRFFRPSANYQIVQLGYIIQQGLPGIWYAPLVSKGNLGETGIERLTPNTLYGFNPRKILQGKTDDENLPLGFIPQRWLNDFTDPANRGINLFITNYILFEHGVTDLSGRKVRQRRTYTPLVNNGTEILEDFGDEYVPPFLAYERLKNRIPSGAPYSMGEQLAPNRGFWEFVTPGKIYKGFWRYSHQGLNDINQVSKVNTQLRFDENIRFEYKPYWGLAVSANLNRPVNELGNFLQISGGFPLRRSVFEHSYPFNRSNYITWLDEEVVREIVVFDPTTITGTFHIGTIHEKFLKTYSDIIIPSIWTKFQQSDF